MSETMTTTQLKNTDLAERASLIHGLLKQWDDLVTRLTNRTVTVEDLKEILRVWEESDTRFHIHSIQFDSAGRNEQSIWFNEPVNLEDFLDYNLDRDKLVRLETLPHTLKIIF